MAALFMSAYNFLPVPVDLYINPNTRLYVSRMMVTIRFSYCVSIPMIDMEAISAVYLYMMSGSLVNKLCTLISTRPGSIIDDACSNMLFLPFNLSNIS